MKKQRVVRVGNAALDAPKEYLELGGDRLGRLFLSKEMKPRRGRRPSSSCSNIPHPPWCTDTPPLMMLRGLRGPVRSGAEEIG